MLCSVVAGVLKKDVVRVHPSQWRAALFPHADWFGKSSSELKRLACTYALCAQPDEAEARCISWYGYLSEASLDAADKLRV